MRREWTHGEQVHREQVHRERGHGGKRGGFACREIRNRTGQLAELVTDLLFPRCCPVCEEVLPFSFPWERAKETGKGRERFYICADCMALLQERCYVGKTQLSLCEKCGRPLERTDAKDTLLFAPRFCAGCTSYTRLFEYCFCLLPYDDSLRRVMADAKYRHKRQYMEALGMFAAARIREPVSQLEIDAVVPVPIHKNRKRVRGYNQSEVLSGVLARELSVSHLPRGLTRRKNTKAQKELDASARMKNLQNAFSAGALPDRLSTVLLIDDIYTTGATMEACTEALLSAGVKRVYGLSICGGRALLRPEDRR